MALIDSLLVFLTGLLLGATGIYISARVILGEKDFSKAFITALFGAFVWTVVGFLFGWIPFLGPLITLLAWIGFVNSMYQGGWVNAFGIAVVAWVSVLVILYLLAVLGVGSFEAIGVPGV